MKKFKIPKYGIYRVMLIVSMPRTDKEEPEVVQDYFEAESMQDAYEKFQKKYFSPEVVEKGEKSDE